MQNEKKEMINTPMENVESIDLGVFLNILWKRKILVLTFGAVFSILSIVYALSIPNIYRASTLLATSDENSQAQLTRLASKFGGLAGLATGIGGGGSSSPVPKAIATMESRFFVKNFVERHQIMIPLMGIKEWKPDSNTYLYDEEVYDPVNKAWVLEIKGKPAGSPPLDYMVYEKFIDLLSIETDFDKGFVTVTFDFPVPQLAKDWVAFLIFDINELSRETEIKNTELSNQYLQSQLKKTTLLEVNNIFQSMIQDNIQKMLLANTRDEFIFTIIDPAIVPEKKYGPRRALIVVLGSIIGGLLTIFGILLYDRRKIIA